MERVLTQGRIDDYKTYLYKEERSPATIEKYTRDILAFYHSVRDVVSKEAVIEYKRALAEKYKATSVNSMLVAINRFFQFLGWSECTVKLLKIQRKNFRETERELTRDEYLRLLEAARSQKNERLYFLMQAICSTGVRVSEHRFITVEAVKRGTARIVNKGKERLVLLPPMLKTLLLEYCRKRGIKTGPVFVTGSGKPVDRSHIWRLMKELCRAARVDPGKVFPHNLRHLFALTYYRLEKDIIHLADILGHSSVETTRIYTATSGNSQKKTLSRLGLTCCLQV